MRTLIALVALILSSSFVSAQAPTPTPLPAPVSEEGDVVKISTTLVQVDVTVVDRKGRVVTDLKPEEVEIYQNGEKQPISHFSFISNIREVADAEPGEKRTDVSLPPTTVRPENVRRTIALVVDDLTLSFESTYWVRRALKKFVDEQMQPGDLVAIIRTGAGIGALQQFTSDRRQLHAAIERVRWNPMGGGTIGAFAPLEARDDSTDDDEDSTIGSTSREEIQRDHENFRQSIFATGTLGAIGYVIRGMEDLPGRKSVMLLSDGFRMFARDSRGFNNSSNVMWALRRLVDQSNRASVVIHTMDARGLQVTGLTAADDTGGRSLEQLEQALSDRRDQLIDTQEGLRFLAQQTGGTSVINNNDLSGGIRKILDDQSYYLVGYEPDDATFDPKTRRFNKLSVKVTRPGVKVRYRSGFFGVSDEALEARKPQGAQRLVAALTSPFAMNEINVRLNAVFSSDAKIGPFVRSLVHVRANDITFSDAPNGTKRAVFDILGVGFGDNGTVVDQVSRAYTMTIDKGRYERMMKKGFVYDFTFPIKKPGGYQLRVAIRDHATNRVGSANQFVEVPNLKKDRLTISGVVLENLPYEAAKKTAGSNEPRPPSDPMTDTSLRQFKSGTILNYGVSVFNPKTDPSRNANLTSQIRLFRDGKLLFEGQPTPIAPQPLSVTKSVGHTGSIVLGTRTITPGDYVLEIAVTDNLAKKKKNVARQFVQFEVIE